MNVKTEEAEVPTDVPSWDPQDITLECFTSALVRPRRKKARTYYDIPAGSGVYALMFQGECLYIGMSSDISRRVQQHGMKIPKDDVLYFLCNESTARWWERVLVAKVNPRGNTKLRTTI